jgi:hypothetical protein
MRSSKLIIRSNAQKQMARLGFGHKFHDRKYFKLEFFFHIPWIHYTLEVIIKYLCRKSSLQCNFTIFSQNLTITCSISPLAHCLLKYIDFFWYFFCQHEFLGFVDQTPSYCGLLYPTPKYLGPWGLPRSFPPLQFMVQASAVVMNYIFDPKCQKFMC